MLLDHLHDELGARAICRIMEFPAAPIGAEVGFVLPAEECTLVMIEPPGQARIAGIFKIDNSVLVPIKLDIKEQLAGTMGEALIFKFTIPVDCIQIEVAEYSCGSQSIEAIVMKIYLHHPHITSGSRRVTCCIA